VVGDRHEHFDTRICFIWQDVCVTIVLHLIFVRVDSTLCELVGCSVT